MGEASRQKDFIRSCYFFLLTRLQNISILDAQRGLQGQEHPETSCKCVFTFPILFIEKYLWSIPY
jgi:hypothetical protein